MERSAPQRHAWERYAFSERRILDLDGCGRSHIAGGSTKERGSGNDRAVNREAKKKPP